MKRIIVLCLLSLLCLAACAPGVAGEITYTVTVLDSTGSPAASVSVQLCKDSACLTPKKTDANGQVTFTLAADDDITAYHLTLDGLPEGQSADASYSFPTGQTALTIRLVQD